MNPEPEPEPEPVCSECGSHESSADMFCVMSDDGEGPHRWAEPELPIPPEDLPFFQRVYHHLELGAQER